MKVIDKEMLVQKFSNYYYDETKDDEAKNFILYDIQRIYYPYLYARVVYQIDKSKKIHQIQLKLLEMIEILSSTKYDNLLGELKTLTKLDEDIFDSIISDLLLKGYITTNPLSLTNTGKEAKNKQNENITEEVYENVYIDSIIGEISLELEERLQTKQLKEETKQHPEDDMELKLSLNFEPRTENLNAEFSDNKTLRTCLIEALKESKKIDHEKEKIWDILEVKRNSKFFQKLTCLFYHYEGDEDKILVVDSKYEKNEELTQRFEKILSQKKLNFLTDSKNKERNFNQHREKREKIKYELSFEEGVNIVLYDFPRYLEHALNHAKKSVYIGSPWIKFKALTRYYDLIEKALQRGIKVVIGYGLNNNKKLPIDEESETELYKFQQYPNFKLYKGNSHAKVLIFDDEWVIKGSFNWLSFGADEKDENTGREEGLLTKNKNTIQESKKAFN